MMEILSDIIMAIRMFITWFMLQYWKRPGICLIIVLLLCFWITYFAAVLIPAASIMKVPTIITILVLFGVVPATVTAHISMYSSTHAGKAEVKKRTERITELQDKLDKFEWRI